eukprot:scaffold740_cov270-Pinguiococcus_pyrenoidosus.AAC.1
MKSSSLVKQSLNLYFFIRSLTFKKEEQLHPLKRTWMQSVECPFSEPRTYWMGESPSVQWRATFRYLMQIRSPSRRTCNFAGGTQSSKRKNWARPAARACFICDPAISGVSTFLVAWACARASFREIWGRALCYGKTDSRSAGRRMQYSSDKSTPLLLVQKNHWKCRALAAGRRDQVPSDSDEIGGVAFCVATWRERLSESFYLTKRRVEAHRNEWRSKMARTKTIGG